MRIDVHAVISITYLNYHLKTELAASAEHRNHHHRRVHLDGVPNALNSIN
jgi:hypothetical protein